ncbi:MAG: YgiQ family radical SAM protein [Spirochaetota bacterium]|nr:YgiQ family radical SAM protein [Spirochaetota bacterium]
MYKSTQSQLFLPTSLKEAHDLGYSELDVILISADAYVDHPAFASAVIGRFLQSLGLRVGIIPQPDWRGTEDFSRLGRPKLFFGVSSGNLDSMLALYTPQRKIRSDDPYSESGLPGRRPYLPTVVYTNRLKEVYNDVPVIIGGIEASLRRVSHYDFYQDKVRPSILLDSKADLLVYGNGEAPLRDIISLIHKGIAITDMKNIRGTAVPIRQREKSQITDALILPSHEEVKSDHASFSRMTKILHHNINPHKASSLYQDMGTRGVLINPPQFPLTEAELDSIYGLPYQRLAHPMYQNDIPALRVVEQSITAHRGCYGGCGFCAIYLHQGKTIQSRSPESIKNEALQIARQNKKPAVITDIGGPSANMYRTFCRDKKREAVCQRPSCIFPSLCKHLETSSRDYLKVLESVESLSNVKNVYINSGIRYDLALENPDFIKRLAERHTQGQLSVAPEHVDDKILKLMYKPKHQYFEDFIDHYRAISERSGKSQFIVPYFIVGHPGATGRSDEKILTFLKGRKLQVKQIQEFCPTPMTLATSIYHTGHHPMTGKPIPSEKKLGQKKKIKEKIINSNSIMN